MESKSTRGIVSQTRRSCGVRQSSVFISPIVQAEIPCETGSREFHGRIFYFHGTNTCTSVAGMPIFLTNRLTLWPAARPVCALAAGQFAEFLLIGSS